MPPVAPSPRFPAAALVDLDPELLAGLDPDTARAARRETQVPMLQLSAGAWDPALTLGDGLSRVWGAIVLEGLLIREVTLGVSKAIELLGPGDLTTTGDPADRMLPAAVTWNAVTPVSLALLDGHLVDVAQRRPAIAGRIVRRAAAQTDRMEVTRAISQLPRIEQRLLALFWHLAERWGRMGASGVVVPLSLTHVTLGQLVGARRPTVSLALKELAADGSISKRPDGSWLLAHGSASVLRATGTPAPAPATTARMIRPTPVRAPAGHGIVVPAVAPVPAAPAGPPAGLLADEGLAELQARVRLLRRQCEAQRLRVSATLDRARKTRERTIALREALSATRDPA